MKCASPSNEVARDPVYVAQSTSLCDYAPGVGFGRSLVSEVRLSEVFTMEESGELCDDQNSSSPIHVSA